MLKFKLLVVDDDDLIPANLRVILPKNWQIVEVSDPTQVPYDDFFNAAFFDMHLSNNIENAEGIEVLKNYKAKHPSTECVAISGHLSLELMESCLQAGANRFLAKPLSKGEVLNTIEKIENLWTIRQATLKNNWQDTPIWIGQSPQSESIRRKIADFSSEKGPFLIEGETGSGKEVVAHLLHSSKVALPMIAVNTAGLPDTLFESEFFGHVKGAFTGADQNKMGLIEMAHEGDLFLDEIEALSLTNQAKLLRFLENGEFRPVGAKENKKASTRIIAASNISLEQLVKEGKFREDLMYRLNTFHIQIPPLRQRSEDLEELIQFFLQKQSPKRNKTLLPETINAIKNYSFPGNVRELKRIIEQASLTSPLPFIRPQDVEIYFQKKQDDTKTTDSVPFLIDLTKGLDELNKDFEKHIVQSVFFENEQDIEKTCAVLKISRSTLYKKIKDYKIEIST